MLKRILLLIILGNTPLVFAQDTFSIVAVDTLTGEVGSAGATCLARSQFNPIGALIISDVIPGVGAIHTQSYWTADNQSLAHDLMTAGDLSPQQILDSMQILDIDFSPEIRQYGAVDFRNGKARSAAFTGDQCMDYKNHIVGPNYAIQGNILLGKQILDSMESRFLRTQGTLGDKLMAALQGAKVPGADTRCLDSGKSSASAFIRVAKPADNPNELYLHLLVTKTPAGMDPIDSLQTLYNIWKQNLSVEKHYTNSAYNVVFENGEIVGTNRSSARRDRVTVEVFDLGGKTLVRKQVSGDRFRVLVPPGATVCFVRVIDEEAVLYAGKLMAR